MKVNFYTQNQLSRNVQQTRFMSAQKPQNNFNAMTSSYELPSVHPAQYSLINFKGAIKTNYAKEIMEQPKVLKNLIDKYFSKSGTVSNLDLGMTKAEAKKITGIKIIASGSSKNVAEMSRDFIEEASKTPTDVYFASEFAHKNVHLNKNDLVLFISQSGETADTFAALQKTNALGLKSIALTNTPGSKIHEGATSAVEVGAGKELAVAATKSVTAQLLNLHAIGLKLGELKGKASASDINYYAHYLKEVPQNLEKMLKETKSVKEVAKELAQETNLHILARGTNQGSAMEGALKLRETTYKNPIASASGEFLHGYVASVDETTPIIQIIQGKNAENTILATGNLKEIIKKGNPKKVFIIKDEANQSLEKEPLFANAKFINIPSTEEFVTPFYVVPRFQMLADELTKILGRNPDNPRGLTKAVTVE